MYSNIQSEMIIICTVLVVWCTQYTQSGTPSTLSLVTCMCSLPLPLPSPLFLTDICFPFFLVSPFSPRSLPALSPLSLVSPRSLPVLSPIYLSSLRSLSPSSHLHMRGLQHRPPPLVHGHPTLLHNRPHQLREPTPWIVQRRVVQVEGNPHTLR